MSRWDGESNKGVYENLGVGVTTIGVGCGVAEWVKPGTLRWFGHVMRMNEDNFVKSAWGQDFSVPKSHSIITAAMKTPVTANIAYELIDFLIDAGGRIKI